MESEVDSLRRFLALVCQRLQFFQVHHVVTVDGPDDPKIREGSGYYSGLFTNGEMADIRAAASGLAGDAGGDAC